MSAHNLLNPDKWDLIRESIIVVTGLIIRFFELRRRKK